MQRQGSHSGLSAAVAQDAAPQKKPPKSAFVDDTNQGKNKPDPLARVNNQVRMQKELFNKPGEERKRAQWGAAANPTDEVIGAAAGGRIDDMSPNRPPLGKPIPKPNVGQRKSSQNMRNPDAANRVRETPQQKKQKMDDLRMTLGHGQGGTNIAENNMLTFHEKVEDIMDE